MALVVAVAALGAVLAYLYAYAPGATVARSGPVVYVLGDSYVEAEGFQHELADQLQGSSITFDGVGGSDLAQQGERFAGLPEGGLLVILDGGFTDADGLADLRSILAHIDSRCARWVYVEPPLGPAQGPSGSEAYRRQLAQVQNIQAAYREHFLPTQAGLVRLADGSEGDRSDVGSGWIPRSVRRDEVHLNDRGNQHLARWIADWVRRGGSGAIPPDCRRRHA